MLDSLGQRVIAATISFSLNHLFLLVILAVVVVFGSQWYIEYIRVNRKTDDVDLMKRYIYLQMRRKYKL